MIIPDRSESWPRRLLSYRGSALSRIKARLAAVTLVSLIVTVVHRWEGGEGPFDLHVAPFTMMGLALGIFLGFRNNTAYDRYWEGRRLWGSLVNTSRSFTRLALVVISETATDRAHDDGEGLAALRKKLVYRTIAYVHALRLHLRDQPHDLAELEPFLESEELVRLRGEKNVPVAILQGTSEVVNTARARGWLHTYHLPLFEDALSGFTDIQGGCERIKNTPIPYSYTVLIHRIVAVYCFGLPFGMVSTTLYATPIVVTLIAYAFLGLDAVGDEIEEPFGRDVNDLPLATLSRMIEVNLRQRLGETDLPSVLEPDEHGTLF